MVLDPSSLLEDANAAPTAAALDEVAALAARQIQIEDSIAETENLLKRQKAALARIAERELPDALAEHGLSEIRMADGSRVEVKRIVRASIPKKHQDEAFEWLRENGLGDLIKNEVKVAFAAGEDAQAQNVVDLMTELGADPEQKASVPWNTLTSVVKERIKEGLEVPTEILGVFMGNQSKITRA